MKFKKVVVVVLLFFVSASSCFAQENDNTKNTSSVSYLVGLQVNPYINVDQLFSEQGIQQYVFALRFGICFKSGFVIGPELSGNYFKSIDFVAHTINYGVFSRYSFFRKKRFSPFVEFSGYYQTNKMTITNEHLFENGQNTFYKNMFSYYGAPGVSIKVVKNIIRIDLMIKASPHKFVNSENFVPSFRVNYYF